MKIYTALHGRLKNKYRAIIEIIPKVPADRIITSPAAD